MAIAIAAAVAVAAVGSWPLKLVAILAFARGLFASDLIAMRNAAPRVRES